MYSTQEEDLEQTERTNVWYNPTMELSTFDVPTPSKSIAQYNDTELRDYFANNCVYLQIRGKGTNHTRHMKGVFTRGHFLLTNGHAFEKEFDEYQVKIIKINPGQTLGPNHVINVRRKDIGFSQTNDTAMIEVLSMPPQKDLTKLWCEKMIPITKALQFIREEDGTMSVNSVFAIQHVPQMEIENINFENVYHGIGNIETRNGMCGALSVATTPRGPIIMGIHALGKGTRTGFIMVLKKELLELEEKCRFSTRPVVQGGFKPKFGLCDEMVISPPHHKSILRYLEAGTLNMYGTFAGFRPKPKSKVCATPLQKEFLDYYSTDVKHGQPCMQGWEPWRKNVIEMIKPNVDYDRDTLKKCVRGYVQDIKDNLPEGWEKNLVVLSDKAAVNGLPGVIFIDGINKKSSMGFPWNRSKQFYLKDSKDEKYPNGVDFDADIWERVRDIENKYLNGTRAYPVFMGQLS